MEDKIKQIEERLDDLETKMLERDTIDFDYMSVKKITGTTDSTAGTESSHKHYLGRTPKMVVIVPKSNGVIYLSKEPDKTYIYVKGSAGSLDFEAYCFL